MKLSVKYKYVFLDFETTWLDISNDFPIQIGLIEVDEYFKIKKHYTSYILLPENIKQLKSNVSYMTWIDMDTITSEWKSIETIHSEINDFFGERTILIWQNILFDINFLKKFFPWLNFINSIDIYSLAASSIPYLKSYSLESIDFHLTEKYVSYQDQKSYIINNISKWKTISAHDALYDCINWLCFLSRWINQVNIFEKEFSIVWKTFKKVKWEWIIEILSSSYLKTKEENNELFLPTLSSSIIEKKNKKNDTIINREKVPQHSKRSTSECSLEEVVSELPHPCIIAVSHWSKIDIIKKKCPNEQFNYLKEEQIFDQEKLSSFLEKDSYTEEEFLFIIFYLSHHRDWYRIITPTLTIHKYILDYLQIKKVKIKNDKKILCSHGWLYYTIQNNPERKNIYKNFTICIFDADRRHTTYNDYAQRGFSIQNILYQREKYEYEILQLKDLKKEYYEKVKNIINNLTFFIAHFTKDNEKYYQNFKQYKRELDYILDNKLFNNTSQSRTTIQWLRELIKEDEVNLPQYLIDIMNKVWELFQNPVKIQRNINQNKDIYYNISPAVRYIDFTEYLKMFDNQKVLFFSPSRSEYTKFLKMKKNEEKIAITYEENIDKTLSIIKKTNWSIFIISHNSEKSKKLFTKLHEWWFEQSHTLIWEHLTWGVAKNATKQTNNKPNIIIWGYHMLLHFWGEGNKIDHIIVCYIHQWMKNFINDDIQQYAIR